MNYKLESQAHELQAHELAPIISFQTARLTAAICTRIH